MHSYYQMYKIELITLFVPDYNSFWLESWWYFEDKLIGWSDMTDNCMMTMQQNY